MNVSFADNKVNGGLEEEGVEYDNMEAVAYGGRRKVGAGICQWLVKGHACQ